MVLISKDLREHCGSFKIFISYIVSSSLLVALFFEIFAMDIIETDRLTVSRKAEEFSKIANIKSLTCKFMVSDVRNLKQQLCFPTENSEV